MKSILIILILFFNFCLGNAVFAQQDVPAFSNLSIGISNRLFVFDGEGLASFGPSIKYKFSDRIEIGSQFYGFKVHSISGATVLRDVSPFLIYSIDTYRHWPFSFKYNWLRKGTKSYFVQFTAVNQFIKYDRTRYTFQKNITTGDDHYFNTLLGGGGGLDIQLCKKVQLGLELYFQTDKNLNNIIYGLNISFDYNLKQ